MLTETDQDGVSWIVEAEPHTGVQQSLLSRYNGRYVLWLKCPAEYSEGVVKAALSYVGQDYSILDYFAIAAQRLDIPDGEVFRRAAERKRHVMCSALADTAASRGGWQLLRGGLWPGYVTPARLAALAEPDVVAERIDCL